MTHVERRERRKRIVEMVKAGASVAEVAAREGLCLNSIQLACREHGLELPRKPYETGSRGNFPILPIVHALLYARKLQAAIARTTGYSQGHVSKIALAMRKTGFKLARPGNKKRAR
ncbi:MAG: hypothetical protein IMZ62_12825 [Chloroflexi bacterium]|nr:hypothetical protein [Chloroflexota bacterium]MBE3119735.1 hypothetical protein [Candidatus Atribacteria bacterium]